MQRVIIIGAGGNSKVIIDLITSINIISEDNDNGEKPFEIIGLLDDDSTKLQLEGFPILGSVQKMKTLAENVSYGFINGIGNNEIRQKIFETYMDINWVTLMHPSVIVAPNVKIGLGSVIMAGVIINTGTVIGKQTLINTGAILEHDNTIGDFAHLASGTVTAGEVKVGKLTMLGTGSNIIQGITIGENSIIGAGSTVIRNIPDNCTAVGVPATVIKRHKQK